MAHWDSEKGIIVHWPTEPYPNYPDWELVDCGCCVGLEWGGDYPRECRQCNGGVYARHIKSRVIALYPGGPFLGSEPV
jgi:hypothetical protein